MSIPHRAQVAFLLVALPLACFTVVGFAKKKEKKTTATQMEESKRALHALQRLSFGPRPGEVDRVAAMGVDKWIDQQLHPERIDDSSLNARLEPYRTLRMDTREIVENFPPQPVIRAVMEGKKPMPSDPVKRAVYQAQIERLEERQERKQEAASAAPPAANSPADQAASDNTATPADNSANNASAASKPSVQDEQLAKHREDRLYADLKAQELLEMPPDQRMKQVLQMPPEEQRALSASLKGPKADEFMEGMNPKQKEALKALNNPAQVVGDELMQASSCARFTANASLMKS